MHQNYLHDLHYHKFKIFQKNHLLIIASFLILTLLPSESWAPPVSGKSARHHQSRINQHRTERRNLMSTPSAPVSGSPWKHMHPPAPVSGKSARRPFTHQTEKKLTGVNVEAAKILIEVMKPLPVTEAKEKSFDNISILEKLGYTGKDATRRFETDFGLKNQSNVDSTAQAIFEAHRNGLSVGSNAILYTIFPGKDFNSLFRYILVGKNKNGNFVIKNNNIHQIRNSINHRHEQIVYLDVTRFSGDRQKALLHSLKLGTIADGEAHFQPITLEELPIKNRSEMRKVIYSPISLEIPNNDAIVKRKNQAEVIIEGTTESNTPFTVRITAKTKKTLRLFLLYLRRIKTHLQLLNSIYKFKKTYPNDKIKIEVRTAAGKTQIGEYLYTKKHTGLAFTPKIYWICNQLNRGG